MDPERCKEQEVSTVAWMILAGFVLCWWLVGVAGFTFWWLRASTMSHADRRVSYWFGIFGPLAWIAGGIGEALHPRERRL